MKNKWKFIFVFGTFFILGLFVLFLLFGNMDKAYMPYGTGPVYICGFIIILSIILFGNMVYLTLTNKITFIPNGDGSYEIRRNYENDDESYRMHRNKHNDGIPSIILIVIILMGLLCLSVTYTDIKNNNNYGNNYVETQSYFIEKRIYSTKENGNITYLLTYRYYVNKDEYYITTDYDTSKIPKIGSEKKVLYNIKNPNDAVFKEYKFSTDNIMFTILGIVFTLIPIIILIKQNNRNKENELL